MAKIVTKTEQTNRLRVILVMATGIAGFMGGRLCDRGDRLEVAQSVDDEVKPKPKRPSNSAKSAEEPTEFASNLDSVAAEPTPEPTQLPELAVAVDPPAPSAQPSDEPNLEDSEARESEAVEAAEPVLPVAEAELKDAELPKVYTELKPLIAGARTVRDERRALRKLALSRPLTAIDGLPSATIKSSAVEDMFGVYRGNLRLFGKGRKGRVRIEIREPNSDKPLNWAVLVELHLDQDTPNAQSTRVTGGLDLLRIAGQEAISLRASEKTFLQLFYRGDDFVGNYYEKSNAAGEYKYAGTIKLSRQR